MKVSAPQNIKIPDGFMRIDNWTQAQPGEWFIYYSPGVSVGRWGYREVQRKWLTVMRPMKHRSYFDVPATRYKTVESAAAAIANKAKEAA